MKVVLAVYSINYRKYDLQMVDSIILYLLWNVWEWTKYRLSTCHVDQVILIEAKYVYLYMKQLIAFELLYCIVLSYL